MNVTAKGYAELVDLLQADIAVLEGGYSVQEALPYVNTGIILSMAGASSACHGINMAYTLCLA